MAFPREYVLGGGRIDPQGITETEDQEIRQLWETMPGHTCYYDAVQRIARGQTVPTHTPEQRSQMETYRP